MHPNEIEHLIGFAQPTTWNGFTPRVHCSFYKRRGREPFDDRAMQLLQPLHHHLQQALTLRSLISDSILLFTARRLVESLCDPAFVLDRDFRIVSANAAAKALFRRRNIVAGKSGRLVVAETRKVLIDLLCTFFADETRLPATGADAGYHPSEITVFNISPVSLNWPEGDTLDHAMVIVRTARNVAHINWSAVKTAFGLTVAETKIAEALVGGTEPTDICDKFRITRETLRTHTKRVLLKTGVGRQSDLIRLVYTTFRISSMPAG